ncbi:MAG: tyrosine-protein phosphatase, partial [Kiritimatiellae bacterium]|nr:tyrosine-protein phosphatase [Kiritimatiellia bacterium]
MKHAMTIVVLPLLPSLFAQSLPPLPHGAFTYVCIPDTQAYSSVADESVPGGWLETNPSFDSRVDWIASNVDSQKVFFVSHMGDVVQENRRSQWDFASRLMSRLDGKVRYGICPGNHDQSNKGGKTGDTSLFSEAFPASRYSGRRWYAEYFGGYTNSAGCFVSGNNANSCQLVDVGRFGFVIMHIENNAPDPVLQWADGVLERHRDRLAIIATHMFIGFRKAKFRTGKAVRPKRETLGLVEWTKRHGREATSGALMWKNHFSRHPNVFLIVCGDQSSVMTHHEKLVGTCGNVVHAFMQDYPKNDASDWLRLFRFQPVEGVIEVFTYSPQRNAVCEGVGCWPEEKWHRFTIPFPMVVADGHPMPTVPLLNEVQKRFLDLPRNERRMKFADVGFRTALSYAGWHPQSVFLPFRHIIKNDLTVEIRNGMDGRLACVGPAAGTHAEICNLEIARTYIWSAADGNGDVVASGEFRTDDLAPRLLKVPGIVNLRDLGGRVGLDGRRVRQGLVFRSAGFNENAQTEYHTQEETKNVLGDRFVPLREEIERRISFWRGMEADPSSLDIVDARLSCDWLVVTGGVSRVMHPDPSGNCWLQEDSRSGAGGTAVIEIELTADGDGYAVLDTGADWYYRLSVNGEIVVNRMDDGAGFTPWRPPNRVLPVKVSKGANMLRAEVSPGDLSWLFRCAVSGERDRRRLAAQARTEYEHRRFRETERSFKALRPGASRLDDAARRFMAETLGIRTDLDLRGAHETFGMAGSPLGQKVCWKNVSFGAYCNLGLPFGRNAFRQAFMVFLDARNYPISFHCISGQDRTG